MSSLELPLNHLILSVAFYLGKKHMLWTLKKGIIWRSWQILHNITHACSPYILQRRLGSHFDDSTLSRHWTCLCRRKSWPQQPCDYVNLPPWMWGFSDDLRTTSASESPPGCWEDPTSKMMNLVLQHLKNDDNDDNSDFQTKKTWNHRKVNLLLCKHKKGTCVFFIFFP